MRSGQIQVLIRATALMLVCHMTLAKTLPLEEGQKPHLTDWFEAEWFDDLVKIPLLIEARSLWYANLVAVDTDDDSEQTGGVCMIDNNGVATVIFTEAKTGDPWYYQEDGNPICSDKTTTELSEDGMHFSGYYCTQKLCVGSWQYQGDEHTTVCNEAQPFYYATSRVWNEWTYYYTVKGQINSICGLGKEEPSSRSQSFISKAFYNGDVAKNMYSFEIDPTLAVTSMRNSHHELKVAHEKIETVTTVHEPIRLRKNPYEFNLESISTLTIGGYDANDISGDLVWYDTSECEGGWNVTATAVTVADMNIMLNETASTIQFQTAYPYIGFPANAWEVYKTYVNTTLNPDLSSKFTCAGVGYNQYCYWYNTYCEDVNIEGSLTFTLGDYAYSIELSSFMLDSMLNTRHDCDFYITQLKDMYANAFRLGDAWFSSFLPVFDVENDQIGLALSARAQDGSSVTYVGDTPVELTQ